MAVTERESGTELNVQFDERGLVPVIVQDVESGQVLMMAWMNDQALKKSLLTRKATFYSRSRQKLWVKGESSGHHQEVIEIRVDCDQDVVLLRCKSHGPCCHVGYTSCFYRRMEGEDSLRLVEERVFDPEKVYG